MPAAKVGDSVDAIDTPALVIDLDAMERNLATMAAFARERRLRLRPHAKMHKSAHIARLQMAAGAVGVCVQKVSEAEALAAAGVTDLYVSNEVVDGAKLARLAALAGRVTLAVAVDSALGIERLAAALKAAGTSLDVFVEIDVGQGRCGVAPTAAGALAHQVVAHGLRFAGLQAYHGRAQHLRTFAEREAAIRRAVTAVRGAQASITSAGMQCPLVTGAGTGSFVFEAASGVYGELQCGSYLFMDRDYADNQADPRAPPGRPKGPGLPSGDDAAGVMGPSFMPAFELALFVKSQVMSRGASHAVVDAGHKSHAVDSGLPRVWQRDLVFSNGGDEHGILMPHGTGERGALPQLGETVWLVPGHCDPTVNLHDHYIALRGGLAHGVVEAVWPIDARGCLS
jgi:D-serine deaminase-like pyridoxal phosphate-dependent protein